MNADTLGDHDGTVEELMQAPFALRPLLASHVVPGRAAHSAECQPNRAFVCRT